MTTPDIKQRLVTVYGPVLILALLVWWIYTQVSAFGFVTFDDIDYVYENTHVTSGINAENLKWAFTNVTHMCWQPLAWISHMLDCQLFGLKAGWHHLTNVILHLVTSVLLYFLFRAMTGAGGKSFVLAVLFAVHPLAVDTVAWVSERKNILMAAFLLLSVYAYVIYVRDKKKGFYALSLLCFIAGFFSKPAIITLPFLLLLLDLWPLNRFNIGQMGIKALWRPPSARLFLEKIPFFALSGAYLFFFNFMLGKMYPTPSPVGISLNLRVANALTSYVHYLQDVLWPHNLCVFYPFPIEVPPAAVLSASFYLLAVTLLVLAAARRAPCYLVGWLWFLGTLVPVIGIVQAGLWPARADRWMYMPMIGILVMLVWGGEALLRSVLTEWKTVTVALVAAAAIALGVTAHKQASYWRNSLSLFVRAADVTKNNFIAFNEIGLALAMEGRFHEATEQFETAKRLNVRYWKPYLNIGAIHLLNGKTDMALEQLYAALKRNPNDHRVHINIGRALLAQERYKKAAASFQKALALKPEDPIATSNLEKLAEMGLWPIRP